jgi:cytochrome c biogenesis protein ResB
VNPREGLATEAPAARRRGTGLERAIAFLTSPKLAIALLIGILACCVVGVTAFSDQRAWTLIFSTIWFNGLLVLLAVSSAAAFFSRIWKRKLTLVQVGMILFHVSFAALLGGVVVNSLFQFRGVLRLTEGETLPNDKASSYDLVEAGRLFDLRRLRGETTLVKVHRPYRVDGADKRVAYEILVREGARQTAGVIYVTRDLEHDGVRYLAAKEGYSVLLVLSQGGREVYGAHVPLQSQRQGDGSYQYFTGTSHGPGSFLFPPAPESPRAELALAFRPSAVNGREGEVSFEAVPIDGGGKRPAARGTVAVGGTWDAGAFQLSPREVRYWVGMDVRYDPGLNVILASLCSGLVGMALIFVGRIRQGSSKARATRAPAPPVGPVAVGSPREEIT